MKNYFIFWSKILLVVTNMTKLKKRRKLITALVFLEQAFLEQGDVYIYIYIYIYFFFGGYVLAWEFSSPPLPSCQPFLYFCSMYGYELWLKIKD